MLRRSPLANDTSSLCRVEACAPVIVFVLLSATRPAAPACNCKNVPIELQHGTTRKHCGLVFEAQICG
jgi:hypothetical protein